MAKIYFPELPDRIFFDTSDTLGKAPNEGDTASLSSFTIMITQKGAGTALTAKRTVRSGETLRVVFRKGRWWLLECKDGTGAIDCKLVGARFHGMGGRPTVGIGAGNGSTLHIRKKVSEPAVFLTVEEVNGDIDKGTLTPKPFDKDYQTWLTWDKITHNSRESLACAFPYGWNPPGNWAGHSLGARPYFAGDRSTGELRLVVGLGRKFIVDTMQNTPVPQNDWISRTYAKGLLLCLSQTPDVEFIFADDESAFDFHFRRPGDSSRIESLSTAAVPLSQLGIDGRDPGIRSARLTANWIFLRFSGTSEAKLQLRAGPNASPAADLVGRTADFFALLPSIASNDRSLFWGYYEANPATRDPYSGLRLAAFPDRAGGALRLDCPGALVSVAATGDSGQAFTGGDCLAAWPPAVPGRPPWKVADRLRVKRDGTLIRQARVRVGETAFLRLKDDEGPTLPSGKPAVFKLKLSRTTDSGQIALPVTGLSAAPIDLFAEDKQGEYAYWDLGLAGAADPFDFADGHIIWPGNFFQILESAAADKALTVADNAARVIDMGAIGAGTSLAAHQKPGRVAYDKAAVALLGRTAPAPVAETAVADPKTHKLQIKDIIMRRTPQNAGAFQPNDGVGRVTYICSEDRLGGVFAQEAQRIIVDAVKPKPGTSLASYDKIWVDVIGGFGLALLLRINGKQVFWHERSKKKAGAKRIPALVIDFNQEGDPGHEGLKLGYKDSEWKDVFDRLDDGKRIFPSDPRFQGHIFRDVSFAFPPVGPKYFEYIPALKNLYDSFEQSVFVDLAWHDGKAWSLRASDRNAPYEFFDNALVHLKILSFTFDLVAGETHGGTGRMELSFPFLLDENNTEPHVDLAFSMTPNQQLLQFNGHTYDFSKNPEYNFGFKHIEKFVVRKIGTDLKTVSMQGDLHFANVSFLQKPVKITLQVPLSDEEDFSVVAELEDVLDAKMDGWGLAITAIALNFAVGGGKPSVAGVTLNGILNLGVDGFFAVYFSILLDGSGDPVVTIDKYEAKLAIGDFSAQLELKYKDKEFEGALLLKSPWTGDLGLAARIWQSSGETSWIATWQKGNIEAANFQLSGPKLALGRRVKIKNGNKTLNDALLDPSAGTVAQAISATDLDKWVADPGTDLVIGACGNFGLHKDWFKAPEDEKKQTGIILGSGGFFRVSAWSDFLGFMTVNYDLTIDTKKKFIFAGFQVPEFDPLQGRTGGSGNSSYRVSGGYVGVGIGYGNPWQFALTVGWPYSSFLDPDVAKPDWSRSVSVHWKGAFPLNTFMGGISLYLSAKNQAFGLALRAGWTWGYRVDAWKLRAEASLGILVAGVLHFTISSRLPAPATGNLAADLAARDRSVTRSLRQNKLAADIQIASVLVKLTDDAFDALLDATDVGVQCGLFLDAWGHARVTFYGVTLLGVKVDAHAQVYMRFRQGRVRSAYANAEFSVKIEIGCKTYETSENFRVQFVDDDSKSARLPVNRQRRALAAPAAREMAHG
jgi:hypothetical protein